MIKVTQEEAALRQRQYARDLILMFKELESDLEKLLNKAAREGWTEGQLMKEIDELI